MVRELRLRLDKVLRLYGIGCARSFKIACVQRRSEELFSVDRFTSAHTKANHAIPLVQKTDTAKIGEVRQEIRSKTRKNGRLDAALQKVMLAYKTARNAGRRVNNGAHKRSTPEVEVLHGFCSPEGVHDALSIGAYFDEACAASECIAFKAFIAKPVCRGDNTRESDLRLFLR